MVAKKDDLAFILTGYIQLPENLGHVPCLAFQCSVARRGIHFLLPTRSVLLNYSCCPLRGSPLWPPMAQVD